MFGRVKIYEFRVTKLWQQEAYRLESRRVDTFFPRKWKPVTNGIYFHPEDRSSYDEVSETNSKELAEKMLAKVRGYHQRCLTREWNMWEPV